MSRIDETVFVRCSALTGYPDCPRRGAARLFRKLIELFGYSLRQISSSIGAPVGTGVHAGAGHTMQHKLDHGDNGPEQDAIESAIWALREAAAPGVRWDNETPEMNTAEKQVIRMTRVYREHVAPDVHPILVEDQFEAEVKPGLVLTGRADLVAREPELVDDLKTGKMLGSHRPQIGGYSLLARSRFEPIDIKKARIDFIQRVALHKPQPPVRVEHIPVQPAETAALNIVMTIDADLRAFRDGDPERRLVPGDPWAFLANPNSKLCSDRWCEAWGTDFCREHEPAQQE